LPRTKKAAPARVTVPAISAAEYRMRREAVVAGMDAMKLDALCVFYPARVAYLTGFHHIPTERPIALVLGPDSYAALVVPAVEKEHAEQLDGIDRLDVYFEYPGLEHPLERVGVALAEIGVQPGRIGADHDGAVPLWGYRGPTLKDVTGRAPVDAEMLVESLRRVKSAAEIECIQLSCDWAVRAHRRMQTAIVGGRTEMECYAPAQVETLREMVQQMPGWRPRGIEAGTGVTAMFVGGRSTAMPHGFVKGRGVQAGDVLVSGAGANIDGYQSELERTMIVGEPNPAQRRAFEAMVALQSRAIEWMKPGVPAAEVELEVVRLADELDVRDRLRHHVGHSIGLEPHEAPFLDRGEEALLEPGMVFTVEPGLYYADLGGFRHSDTVVITDDGCRVMTDYPRALEELVIAV
jgi:Xaa-Pro aminopeptidase